MCCKNDKLTTIQHLYNRLTKHPNKKSPPPQVGEKLLKNSQPRHTIIVTRYRAEANLSPCY